MASFEPLAAAGKISEVTQDFVVSSSGEVFYKRVFPCATSADHVQSARKPSWQPPKCKRLVSQELRPERLKSVNDVRVLSLGSSMISR